MGTWCGWGLLPGEGLKVDSVVVRSAGGVGLNQGFCSGVRMRPEVELNRGVGCGSPGLSVLS